jgi:hypothetical protein
MRVLAAERDRLPVSWFEVPAIASLISVAAITIKTVDVEKLLAFVREVRLLGWAAWL